MKKAEEQETNMENTSEGLRIYERYSKSNNSRVSEIKRKFITILNVVYILLRNFTVFFLNIISDHTNTFATPFYGFKIPVAVEMELLDPQPFTNNNCHFLSSVEYTKMGQ